MAGLQEKEGGSWREERAESLLCLSRTRWINPPPPSLPTPTRKALLSIICCACIRFLLYYLSFLGALSNSIHTESSFYIP